MTCSPITECLRTHVVTRFSIYIFSSCRVTWNSKHISTTPQICECVLGETPQRPSTRKSRHYYLLFSMALQSSAGYVLVREVSWSHTTTLHSRYDSSRRVISSSQRPLTTHTTSIHAPGEIQNHYRSRRTAVDLRLKPRGHWDRQKQNVSQVKSLCMVWTHVGEWRYISVQS
jgi:hypothetical protein